MFYGDPGKVCHNTMKNLTKVPLRARASIAQRARIDELDLAVTGTLQAGARHSVGQAGNPATMKPRKKHVMLKGSQCRTAQ
ncbi:hypothetical protein GCM10007905_27540 [Mixta theicola]|nr:hypothetical protein GCM10007905_27540 [Mixta theicola]